MVFSVEWKYPDTPLIFHANGGHGKLHEITIYCGCYWIRLGDGHGRGAIDHAGSNFAREHGPDVFVRLGEKFEKKFLTT